MMMEGVRLVTKGRNKMREALRWFDHTRTRTMTVPMRESSSRLKAHQGKERRKRKKKPESD